MPFTYTCDGCGIEFIREQRRKDTDQKVYHSRDCMRETGAYRGNIAYTKSTFEEARICSLESCQNPFVASHHGTKYCSKPCRTRAGLERRAASWEERNVAGSEISQGKTREYKMVLLEDQKSCSICKRDFSDMDYQQIHVDHDHTTGKIRCLLCFKCNAGLGQFNDSIKNLLMAIFYLLRHRTLRDILGLRRKASHHTLRK